MPTESFFSSASLAYIASAGAGKDGKTYSIKPADGSGDFTFSRGSNLAATRVGPTGLIEKGRENLLLQSNNFDTTWSAGNFSFSDNQSDKDGGTNAWKATCSTTYNYLSQNFSGSGVYTFSGYFRKGDSNEGVRFNFSASADTNVYVDLTDGSSTDNGNLIYKSITDAGNGFYKVVVSANLTSPTSLRFFVTNGVTTQVAGNIYIQEFQLEIGLAATDYIESGATTGKAGLLENEPRFDYSGGATCPSLLLEPSRTNLVQSEYLNGISGLSKIGTSFDTNATTSPEGLDNASLLKEDSSNGSHFAYKDFALTNGSTYTISIFAKAGGVNRNLKLGDGGVGWGSGFNVNFDLTAGTATSGGTIEPMGNDWYRCSVTGTTNATTCRLIIYSLLNTATSYQGDGSSGVYLYGFQVEEGSYPTSYIPNHSGGSVTRGVDDINKLTGVGVTSDEFTIFLELDLSDTPLVSNVGTYFQTFDSSNNSQQEFRFFSYSGEQVLVPYFRQDASYAFGNGGNAVRFDGKVLFRSDGGGSYTMFFGFNGSSTKEVRTGLTAYTLNKIDFISQPKTNVKQLLIFNEALSDADCTTLTT